MRLQNARGLLESKQKQQESDRQEVDRLAALIDDRAGEGIYDKLKAAEESLESLQLATGSPASAGRCDRAAA
jgi:acetylglutamate kinase